MVMQIFLIFCRKLQPLFGYALLALSSSTFWQLCTGLIYCFGNDNFCVLAVSQAIANFPPGKQALKNAVVNYPTASKSWMMFLTMIMLCVFVLTNKYARYFAFVLLFVKFFKRLAIKLYGSELLMFQYRAPNWGPSILDWLPYLFAILLLSYIDIDNIENIASAMYGGLLLANSAFQILQVQGLIERNQNDSDSWFDILSSYIVAAISIYFRLHVGYLPFRLLQIPFDLLQIPFDNAEYLILWLLPKLSN